MHSIVTTFRGAVIKVEVANFCAAMDTLIDQDVCNGKCPTLLHMTTSGNRTPDSLILVLMLYPLGHVILNGCSHSVKLLPMWFWTLHPRHAMLTFLNGDAGDPHSYIKLESKRQGHLTNKPTKSQSSGLTKSFQELACSCCMRVSRLCSSHFLTSVDFSNDSIISHKHNNSFLFFLHTNEK